MAEVPCDNYRLPSASPANKFPVEGVELQKPSKEEINKVQCTFHARISSDIQSNLYISLASGPEDPMLLERLCVYRGCV